MNKTNFPKSKLFFLTLFLMIGIVIAIPISTTWVFNDVFSLNYTKTTNCEPGVDITNSDDNCESGDVELSSIPNVDLKAVEVVNDLQKTINVSTVDTIPFPQNEDSTLQVINEDILEEASETLIENQTETLIENQTETLIETPTKEIVPFSYTINKISSGLEKSESFTDTSINDYWTFGGNAEGIQAPHDHFTDADGLHIGVQAPEPGVYVGHNAKIPPTNGTLFHSKITTPTDYIPNEYLQNGIYVQSSDGAPNFVTCTVITNESGKLKWIVTRSYFDINGISQYELLWSDDNPKPSLSRECTIITNGDNFLRIILDRTEVYANYKLDLQMTGPFVSFLETQTSYAEEKLYGTYEDFYVTSDATIQILNVPGYIEKMTLTDMSNNILTTGHVINGTGFIDVANFHFPLTANIHAIHNQRQIISTPSPVNIFGGDIYSVEPLFLN